MASIFLDEFDREYYDKLTRRKDTFRLFFQQLETEAQKRALHIVETGALRKKNNWHGDGQSTYLFDRFLHYYPTCTVSVFDVSEDAISVCKEMTNHQNLFLYVMDSVKGIWEKIEHVDAAYLDSFDFDSRNPHPSAFHHMKEIAAIFRKSSDNCLIMIDDNHSVEHGKCKYVRQFMSSLGISPQIEAYQILYSITQ